MKFGQDNPTMTFAPVDLQGLAARLNALRPADGLAPAASVVVPVNARGDLRNVQRVLSDVGRYDGAGTLEVILVVNNFPEDSPPAEIKTLEALGARVLAVPDIRKPGEAPGFSARIPGVRAAASEQVVLFDADCRIPHPAPLIDWYAAQLRGGATAAYTHVAYYDFTDAVSIQVRFALHHSTRWFKRTALGIPTTRGSNYAVRRSVMLDLYERGLLADEMNVGPAFQRHVGRVAYSRDPNHTVYTSGRMFRPGWRRIAPYLLYRLRYNLRVLPVHANVAARTGRERDPVREVRRRQPSHQVEQVARIDA